jgi:hypothetical protein
MGTRSVSWGCGFSPLAHGSLEGGARARCGRFLQLVDFKQPWRWAADVSESNETS